MASMRSSSRAPRVFGSVPWSRNSSIFQPAPTPNTNRPPEIRSILAASLAVMIGSRWISSAIPVNSSILEVTAIGSGQSDERIERSVVHRRQFATRPDSGVLPAGRDVRVLSDDQRVETPLFDRTGQ